MTYSTISWKALLVTAALTLPTLAFAADPAMTKDGMLVDHNGMTLYTFDSDKAGSGKSACNGPCAGLWPPLMATATDQPAGDFSDAAAGQAVLDAARLSAAEGRWVEVERV